MTVILRYLINYLHSSCETTLGTHVTRHFFTWPDASFVTTRANRAYTSVKFCRTVGGWAAFHTPAFDDALKAVVDSIQRLSQMS